MNVRWSLKVEVLDVGPIKHHNNSLKMTELNSLQAMLLRLSLSLMDLFQHVHLELVKRFTFPERRELPDDINIWRVDIKNYEVYWKKLATVITFYGYTPFKIASVLDLVASTLPLPSNFIYAPPHSDTVAACTNIRRFGGANCCMYAAEKDRRHYVIRVMSIRGRAFDILRIVRMVSQSPDNLRSNYHILPMLDEFAYHDIIFGVFPMVATDLRSLMLSYESKNTVEDIVYMLIQALEAVEYIHGKSIAHRNLFMDNFVVDFNPQSTFGRRNWTRPRVYLTDFEAAIHFPDDVEPHNRLASGLPLPFEIYNRELAPELCVSEEHLYCPFKLDMWQFANHILQSFAHTDVADLDNLWPLLASENPADRPTAQEALQKLTDFVVSVPPTFLHRTYKCPLVISY